MGRAQNIVAVDPVAFKTDQAKMLGATHTAASMEEATGLVRDITRGVMADVGVNTIGVVEGWMIQPFLDLVSKGGRAVLTGMARNVDDKATLGLQMFSLFEKSLLGTVYGGCNPRADIPASPTCTGPESSSSTSWSPVPTPSTRSTRATPTCSQERTSAA
ncbi:zinc-binding dehydrogenase [Streptomyces sp. INA 01156]